MSFSRILIIHIRPALSRVPVHTAHLHSTTSQTTPSAVNEAWSRGLYLLCFNIPPQPTDQKNSFLWRWDFYWIRQQVYKCVWPKRMIKGLIFLFLVWNKYLLIVNAEHIMFICLFIDLFFIEASWLLLYISFIIKDNKMHLFKLQKWYFLEYYNQEHTQKCKHTHKSTHIHTCTHQNNKQKLTDLYV